MKGGTSSVVISDEYVIKTIRHFISYSVIEREIYMYKLFNTFNFNWCPKLISYDINNKTITVEYKGMPISNINMPYDWEEQLELILYDMKSLNVKHNDIRPPNLLVMNDKLYLIDFQWCTINNTLNLDGNMYGGKLPPGCNYKDETAILRLKKYLYNTT